MQDIPRSAVSKVNVWPHTQVEDQAAASTVNLRDNSATSKERAKLLTLEEEPSDCEDALEMTYVSETDTDITEVQTVPYTHSPLHQGPEGQRSGPEQDRGGLVSIGLEAEEKEEHSQLPAEEDDSLRLVRDFFFTWWWTSAYSIWNPIVYALHFIQSGVQR